MKLFWKSLLVIIIFSACEDEVVPPVQQPDYPFSVTDFRLSILNDALVGTDAEIDFRIINFSDSNYTVSPDYNGGFFRIRFKMINKNNVEYGRYVTIPTIQAKDTLLLHTSVPMQGQEYLDLNGTVEFVKN